MIKKQSGMNMVEVLIAALLLSVALLGLAGLQISSMKMTHNSYQMQQATQLLQELLERMRANTDGVLAGNYVMSASAANYCNQALTNSCETASCDPAGMAGADLYRTVCGYGEGSGMSRLLLDSSLAVSCPAGGDCTQGVQLDMQWNERNASGAGNTEQEVFNLSLSAYL